MASNPPVLIPIGTSDPLDLSAGLPLFPEFGTARAGISASSRSYKLFEIPLLVICLRLKISVYAGYGFGIVGPAVAFLAKGVTVARANNGTTEGQLTLTFNNGLSLQAGAFVGAYVSAGVTARGQLYLPKPWYKVWAWSWQTVFTIEKDFKIDLLDLMFKLIQYLLKKKANPASFAEDKQNKLKETELGVKSFGMAGTTNTVRANLTATPEVTAPLNLANYVPKLREINLALAKIDGHISFGPTAHLQYPVTFNLTGFTVEGSVQGASSALYNREVQYRNGNQVTAKGDRLFNLRENPSKFTTHVRYETVVKLAMSIHAEVKVAKFFRIGVNTPSLDLTYLLYRIPERNRTVSVPNSVTTEVGGGCVLTPNMTLRFEGPNGSLEIKTGEVGVGNVVLAGFQSATPVTINLEIDPPVPSFPTSVNLPARSQGVKFFFQFQNQCMPTGNRENLEETAPPNALSSIQAYRVRATLKETPAGSCTDYRAETPLSITNRFIRCQASRNTSRAINPPWDDKASAKIVADDIASPSGGFLASADLWFPYVGNEQPVTVPVTFTLVNENREPYDRSDVEILAGGTRKFLSPSCTFNLRLRPQIEIPSDNGSFAIYWNSRGKPSGYANRFYLLVTTDCQYGRSEFWLDVWNWS
ncbi:MAG: hypothetical protein ABJF23_28875 [Bryobacteraceae bacterium]